MLCIIRNFIYKDFSCFMYSKNTKDIKLFYIKISVVLSSVKRQRISSFFYIKISVVLSSVKIQRISSFFDI